MKNKFSKILLTLVLVLTLAAFVIPSASVSADDGDTLKAKLEQWFAREQDIQAKQIERLERGAAVIEKTHNYIDKEKAAGYDTSALEAALAQFEAAFAENTTLNAAAQALIDSRAGFDADGKVTSVPDARQTVKEIGRNQRRFHLNAVEATIDLRDALRAYRELNHPRP